MNGPLRHHISRLSVTSDNEDQARPRAVASIQRYRPLGFPPRYALVSGVFQGYPGGSRCMALPARRAVSLSGSELREGGHIGPGEESERSPARQGNTLQTTNLPKIF